MHKMSVSRTCYLLLFFLFPPEYRLLRAKDSGRRMVEKALTGREHARLEEKIMIDPDIPYWQCVERILALLSVVNYDVWHHNFVVLIVQSLKILCRIVCSVQLDIYLQKAFALIKQQWNSYTSVRCIYKATDSHWCTSIYGMYTYTACVKSRTSLLGRWREVMGTVVLWLKCLNLTLYLKRRHELVWPNNRVLGWWADRPRFGPATTHLSLQVVIMDSSCDFALHT